MFPLLINPLPLLLTITTSFGVLIHDAQLDRIASTAVILPAGFAVFAVTEEIANISNEHTHTESIGVSQNIEQLRSDQPFMQSRGNQDKKYISVKKYSSNGIGSEYYWPSI